MSKKTPHSIQAREDFEAVEEKAHAVVAKLKAMRLRKASETVAEGYAETLTYMRDVV